MGFDKETKQIYNRNKSASKASDSVVKIQQRKISKVVDKCAERHYNRNKSASNGACWQQRINEKLNAIKF